MGLLEGIDVRKLQRRILLIFLVFACLVPVKSSSQTLAKTIEAELQAYEEDLEAYRERITREGEALFYEEKGIVERTLAQKFQLEAKKLQEEVVSQAQEKMAKLEQDLLYQNLQLILVDLEEHEQESKLQQIMESQEKLETLREESTTELEGALNELALRYTEKEKQQVDSLKKEWEIAMEQEFSSFKEEREFFLTEEIRKLSPKVRTSFLNRSY